jgi:hypothetical protein
MIDSSGRPRLDDAVVGHLRRTFDGNTEGHSALVGLSWGDFYSPQGKASPQPSKAGDVYDFATLAYEVPLLRPPLNTVDTDRASFRSKVCLSGTLSRKAYHRRVDYSPLWAILQFCWAADPRKRPSMASVLSDLHHLTNAL